MKDYLHCIMQCAIVVAAYAAVPAAVSCTAQRKLGRIREKEMSAVLQLPKERQAGFQDISSAALNNNGKNKDTLTIIGEDGREMLVMKAIRDEDGEMVAAQQLDAAVVTARFRNVAERHGRIDLEFQVIVPPSMQDGRWQLRMTPDMFIQGDSIRLDSIMITGRDYRRLQLKGYQRYERFLNSIITDTTRFIDLRDLEIFLKRNIPELYSFKTDSTDVSDEQFNSVFGVTQREAVDHYTNMLAVKWNENRKNRRDKMYARYVKAPIVSEGIRLDTVIVNSDGDFVYNYVQTINTRPKLRKADIVLSGSIYEQGKKLYSIPPSEPLTFYISSLSAFVDGTERYLTRVMERRATVSAAWNIDFRAGGYRVDENFSRNREEMDNIRMNLRNLLVNDTFDLDSITIAASASPEGTFASNNSLSARRAAGVSDYFSAYTRHLQDSLKAEAGVTISVDDNMRQGRAQSAYTRGRIVFRSRSAGENWGLLRMLVDADTLMTEGEKENFISLSGISDPDRREALMRRQPYYSRMRKEMYPRLRTVQFQFAMHRRGMVKDTVHTTELDTVYMKGVQAIIDRDYETAIALLTPYQDYNLAIACVAIDRNASAMNILRELGKTPQVNYMLAILYAREGDDRNAVQHYMNACSQDRSYVNRGNLDPEIAALIRKYDLNRQRED